MDAVRRQKKEAEMEEEELMAEMVREKDIWKKKAVEMEQKWQQAEKEVQRLRKLLQ
jgi:hypothetical protein